MSDAPEIRPDPVPKASEQVEGSAPRRTVTRRPIRRVLSWSLVVLVVAVVWLLQGGGGQRLVMDVVLSRVQSAFAGELSVQGIRSNSLLFSATLTGVRLEAAGDRPFLEADSVRVRYSALGMLMGKPSVIGLTLWSPRLEISTYPGEDLPNVSRLLKERDPGADPAAGSEETQLGRIVIHDGLLEVLSPAGSPAPARIPTVPAPTGEGRLRRLALERIEGQWDDVVLHPGEEEFLTSALRSLALDVFVLDEPLRITDGRGWFTYGRQGIRLEDGEVSLPGSELTGSLRVGPGENGGPWRFTTDLTATSADLSDLRWLDARMPEGTFTGRVEVAAGGGVDVVFHQVDANLEASQLMADGAFRFDGGFELRELDVTASPLVLARLEPWLQRTSPLEGWLSGRVVFDGTPEALSTEGRVTLVPTGYGGRPTTADISGVVHFGDDPGATNFGGRLDPLNFDALEAIFPALRIQGAGSADFQLSGRVANGLRFTSDVAHFSDSLSPSRVVVTGTMRWDSTQTLVMDAAGDLLPLSLSLVNGIQPALDLQGDVRGSVTVAGPLRDLRVTGDVEVGGGRMTVEAGADVTALAQGYSLDLELDDVDLSQALVAAPAPANWSGRLSVEARGLTLDSLEGSASVVAFASRVGGLYVDTVSAALRASDGGLRVDTLFGLLGGVAVSGSGSIGLAASRYAEASFEFSTDSLLNLRPFFMGDSVIARDELSSLDRRVLSFAGIDPDTLPLSDEVAMSGALAGTVGLTGSVDDLNVTLSATLEDGVYRRQSIGQAQVMLEVHGLPARTGEWAVVVDANDLDLARWAFEGAHVEAGGAGRVGRGWVEIRHTEDERYGASGGFALDSAGGSVDLELATLRLDSVVWEMTGPSRITWDSNAVRVADFEASRGGDDGSTVTAAGVLSRVAESDFNLDVKGLHLDRVAGLLQFDREEVAGHVDLSVVVRGPAGDPVIDARVYAEDPRYGDVSVDRLLSVVQYRRRVAAVELEAWSQNRSVFTGTGSVPVDLSLTPMDHRIPDTRDMDVQVRADSLDAAGLLSVVGILENVSGWVSGEFNVRGSLDEPEPSGTLRLHRAAWSIDALGVRHTDVTGLLTLYPDRRVGVAIASRANGVSDVTGDLDFSTLSNPLLDLTITFQQFQAVDRRDVTGLISGSTTLTGSYHRPVVRGSLNVDEGTLFLEEFARSASVVDLTDASLFERLDTAALVSRPLIGGLRNPFMDSLRVDVQLAVPRDTWLRSPEMNVEIGGDLLLLYDRGDRELVMVGDLQALRGQYSVLGRRFEVQSGTVGFIGIPGINPTLDIEAVSRIRRMDGDPLDVTASVAGTLIQPRVTLASLEEGLAESDLVSYLIFGRPTHQLATGQQAAVGDRVAGAAASRLFGTLGTAFGSVVAQGVGVDYLSISQAGDFAGLQSIQGSFAGTQVEIGQYLSADVFVVVLLRPPDQTSSANSFGTRVEWSLTDNLTAEGFIEDRFLRNQSLGAGDLTARTRRVVGVFVFREWGY